MKTARTLELNAAETFLMNHLKDVVLLEKSMKAVRQKYDRLWEQICQGAYPELKYRSIHASDRHPQVGLGKQSWPSDYDAWPSGFYIWAIGLENLCHDDADHPQVGIWIKPPKRLRINLTDTRERIREKAQRILGNIEDAGSRTSGISFWCDLPESRENLLQAFTQNGAQRFTAIMTAHFRSLAPLIPELDRIFQKKR